MRKGLPLAVATVLVCGVMSAQSASAHVNPSTFSLYTHGDTTSQYHVYANAIDWTQPVGVVFFFDGDYSTSFGSRVEDPNDPDITGMAGQANAGNYLFVPVVSPEKDNEEDGTTWWHSPDSNGDWFRAFAQWFIHSAGVDPSEVWTMGYSGGAEFITMELGADRQNTWRTGGGKIMVGGGEYRDMQTPPDPAALKMPWYWYAGDEDGTNGEPSVGDWSAYEAAQRGYEGYTSQGFKNTVFLDVEGKDHGNYDLPIYLKDSMEDAGITARPHIYSILRSAGSVGGQPTGVVSRAELMRGALTVLTNPGRQ